MSIQKKIRVAIMSYAMDNRRGKGTAVYTRKLVENLLEDERFDLTLVHYESVDDPLYSRAHEIVMPLLRRPFGTRFVRQLLFFWQYRHERFDIMHWCQPRLYPFFWLAPATHTIVTMHGAGDVTAGGSFPLSRRMFNFVLTHFNSKLSAIIADSHFGKEEIVEWYHAISERVYSIYLGGAEEYRPLDKVSSKAHIEEKYGINGDFILDISRHVAHKNIPALVRAYIDLQKKFKQIPKLVIVGNPDVAFAQAEAAAAASPSPENIVWVRYAKQEDLNAFYAAAIMFVYPSLNEGFGLPIIEAFASGTPVITSNITSMPEIAGEAALIVDPLNESSIADGISQLLFDNELQQSLIKKGIERAQEFTWKKTVMETASLYLKVTAE
jgi:glycosyltransferase involved in cell wall biosynthesis